MVLRTLTRIHYFFFIHRDSHFFGLVHLREQNFTKCHEFILGVSVTGAKNIALRPNIAGSTQQGQGRTSLNGGNHEKLPTSSGQSCCDSKEADEVCYTYYRAISIVRFGRSLSKAKATQSRPDSIAHWKFCCTSMKLSGKHKNSCPDA